MTIKATIFRHHPRVSHARFSLCWGCHNWLLVTSQWPDNCDAITWIVISNSLDIDFIHGNFHDRSCKKYSKTIGAINMFTQRAQTYKSRQFKGTKSSPQAVYKRTINIGWLSNTYGVGSPRQPRKHTNCQLCTKKTMVGAQTIGITV